tara:strand:- start:125 stop:373 length:249 start_codon:yes stop_codon:yes gene_type:complete
MLVVQCKDCRKELSSASQTKCCGCPNMMTIQGETVTAVDLERVIMVQSNHKDTKLNALSPAELAWQEERRKRKVRKLDFEIR